MRHGSRDDAEPGQLVHQLNQRYRQEFDRAERLRAELVAIQGSRLWPWFCRLRRWGAWGKSIFRHVPVEVGNEPSAGWCRVFEPAAGEGLRPGQVSIVIPFRDQLDLLTRCLQSLRQTAPDAELVLVD